MKIKVLGIVSKIILFFLLIIITLCLIVSVYYVYAERDNSMLVDPVGRESAIKDIIKDNQNFLFDHFAFKIKENEYLSDIRMELNEKDNKISTKIFIKYKDEKEYAFDELKEFAPEHMINSFDLISCYQKLSKPTSTEKYIIPRNFTEFWYKSESNSEEIYSGACLAYGFIYKTEDYIEQSEIYNLYQKVKIYNPHFDISLAIGMVLFIFYIAFIRYKLILLLIVEILFIILIRLLKKKYLKQKN